MQIKKTGLYVLAILLLFPALFINLGLLTFIDDEGIRSLVALEMNLSSNFITPTLHGDFYYKKPPLFNWILWVFFKGFGTYNETVARIPTVLALMAYAGTIFWYLRSRYGHRFAFIAAFMLITCGRILFWDSMLGLIDITFSWIVFLLFISVYHFYQKQRYWAMFLAAYLLTAVGFLLKGLPAIVFVGITMLTYLIYKKDWKRIFSIQHIASGLLCLAIIGGYYGVYH
ncbi:MAG: glycosyltransferase family 39 protein, partial [Bacteroidota bacterium]